MKKLIIFSLFSILLLCLCWCKNQSYTIWSTVITITNAEEIEVPIVVIKSDKKLIKEFDNYLPMFDDLTLSITGLSSHSYWNIFDRNLVVKLAATNAEDIDWGINYFKWYYYYKDDPSRRLETKITPGTVNYTHFELKEPWEYMFWVAIYDNNEWKTVSEDVLWNWPIVLLTQDSKNIDIPIVTLKIDKNNVKIWEEVVFHVFSKVISERSDFDQERTIRYDFDWNGERDLTTKDDEVTYVYEKANTDGYIPRVWVLYRWYEWTTKWWTIIVKDPLNLELY